MYVKIHGVVLTTVKYNDRQNIVRIYTDQRGLMAFAVVQGTTRGARSRAALLQPLSLIEAEASVRPGREVSTLRDLRAWQVVPNLYGNPVKTAIAMYVSELLSRVVVEQERNRVLFDFIEGSVRLLDGLERGVGNFHLCFTFRLGGLIGIEPDVGSYRDGWWFDMAEGVFRRAPSHGEHWLRPEQARVIHLLSRMTYANMHLFRFTRDQRNEILDTMLAYFRLHQSALGSMRSPEVLRRLW